MPVTPKHSRKSTARGKPGEGRVCPSCAVAILAAARFCHACGASLEAVPGGRKWPVGRLVGLAAFAILIAAGVFAVGTFAGRDAAPPSVVAPPAPLVDGQPGAPPDLSRMTPRQAADRLFNRIMAASEKGNHAEALSFVAMAVQAYGELAALDRDAHYHLGLIHGVAGDGANVDRQIAALRRGAPNHLLALELERAAAERAGDRAALPRILAAVAAAYDAEVATQRPEYGAHHNTIEKLRATAAQATAPTAAQAGGAALFAKTCSACHGLAAAGSDKGPPLVHKIYEPGHHGDDSIRRAVREGVRAHHWPFGDMAPVPGIADGQLERIIAHVRGLQRDAGIR